MNMHSGRLAQVRARIERACLAAGREADSVRLLAVSKNHGEAAVRALLRQGQSRFGENRLQEALVKRAALDGEGIEWHFIGPIQSNKTRDIARHFDWVQSVDREKTLRRLVAQRPDALPPLNICLQVNIDAEEQKAGLAPAAVKKMAERAAQADRIRLRGLMCIPKAGVSEARTLDSFARLRGVYEELQTTGHDLDTLSMGMSADLELAIQAGSTLVRIGTDLFGPRPQ